MKKNLLYLSFLFLVATLNSCCKEQNELSTLCRQFYEKKGPDYFQSALVGSQDTTYSVFVSPNRIGISVHGPSVMFLWSEYSSFTEEFVFENRGNCDRWRLVSYSFEDKIDHVFKSYKADETKNLIKEKEKIMRKFRTLIMVEN